MPILDPHTLESFSKSPEQTRRLGMRLGALLLPGDTVCLQGNLGAGKTTFVQGMAQGWGSADPATSPTFVLVNEYQRPDGMSLFHLDAYRIETAAEAEELDLETMLAEGVLVVEWPERIAGILPAERMWVELEYVSEEHRDLVFNSSGTRYEHLLAGFQQAAYGVG